MIIVINKAYIITTVVKLWPIKVGVSYDPRKRIRELQTGHWELLRVYEIFDCPGNGAFMVERMFHFENRAKRMQGEWFDMSATEAKTAMQGTLERYAELM